MSYEMMQAYTQAEREIMASESKEVSHFAGFRPFWCAEARLPQQPVPVTSALISSSGAENIVLSRS
jgi:hypothetical protein